MIFILIHRIRLEVFIQYYNQKKNIRKISGFFPALAFPLKTEHKLQCFLVEAGTATNSGKMEYPKDL